MSTLFCWGKKERRGPESGQAVALVVVDSDGVSRPGHMLRAGDFIERTDYDHGRRVLTATLGAMPLPLLTRLRRWREGKTLTVGKRRKVEL